MIDAPHPDAKRTARALDRALAELEERTTLPVRLLAQDATDLLETFEFQEEDDHGHGQRRFLVSVDQRRQDLLVVVLPVAEGMPA